MNKFLLPESLHFHRAKSELQGQVALSAPGQRWVILAALSREAKGPNRQDTLHTSIKVPQKMKGSCSRSSFRVGCALREN